MRKTLLLGLALAATLFATVAYSSDSVSDEVAYQTSDYKYPGIFERTVDVKVSIVDINASKLDYMPDRVLIKYVSRVNVLNPLPLDLGAYRLVWEDG